MNQKTLENIKADILTEANSLMIVAERLSPVLAELVEELLKLKGRAVFCGMGKSGHIARKVAATMSSTGTPSFYLHPSESLHGDLGQVTKDDMVICISKSGENPELNLMLPSLERIGAPVVALTSTPDSSLGRVARWVIDMGEIREICPLELAPTTSATVSLVLLDAVAMELMRRRDFKPDDYALFHPGGRLGRRLLFCVRDLMHPVGKAPTVNPNTPALDLLHAMTQGRMGAALVTDDGEKLLGLVTDHDVRKFIESGKDVHGAKTGDIMNSAPSTCLPGDKAYEVLVNMRTRKTPITLMPVVDENFKARGILTLEAMVQHGLA